MKQIQVALVAWLITLSLCCATAMAESVTLNIWGKSIAGEFNNPVLRQTHPNISWIGNDTKTFESAKDMAFQMLTQDGNFDIYSISYAYGGFEYLYQKGYCYDLSSSPEVVDVIEKMYPYLKDAVIRDNGIFGIPISTISSGWAYDMENCTAVGLTPDTIPTTYTQMLDLLKWWLDEGADLYPDYQFTLDTENIRQYLVNNIVYEYIMYCQQNDLVLKFDTDEFKSLLERIDRLDTDYFDELTASATRGIAYEQISLFVLGQNYLDFTDHSVGHTIVPMPLALTENGHPSITADIRVFIINPLSLHKEEAIDYLLSYLESLDELNRILLFKDCTSPIENPDYALEMAEALQRLEEIQLLLAKEGALINELQEERALLQLGIVQIESNKWYVSDNQIAAYQSMADRMCVRKQNILERNSTEGVLEIRGRTLQYIARTISLKEFVSDVDRIVYMINAEDIE